MYPYEYRYMKISDTNKHCGIIHLLSCYYLCIYSIPTEIKSRPEILQGVFTSRQDPRSTTQEPRGKRFNQLIYILMRVIPRSRIIVVLNWRQDVSLQRGTIRMIITTLIRMLVDDKDCVICLWRDCGIIIISICCNFWGMISVIYRSGFLCCSITITDDDMIIKIVRMVMKMMMVLKMVVVMLVMMIMMIVLVAMVIMTVMMVIVIITIIMTSMIIIIEIIVRKTTMIITEYFNAHDNENNNHYIL